MEKGRAISPFTSASGRYWPRDDRQSRALSAARGRACKVAARPLSEHAVPSSRSRPSVAPGPVAEGGRGKAPRDITQHPFDGIGDKGPRKFRPLLEVGQVSGSCAPRA
jgi:hypothetical protein